MFHLVRTIARRASGMSVDDEPFFSGNPASYLSRMTHSVDMEFRHEAIRIDTCVIGIRAGPIAIALQQTNRRRE
jgi:hypothetical protein